MSASFDSYEKTIKVYTNLNISPTPTPQTYSQNDESEYELWVDNTTSSKVPVIYADGEFIIPARPLVEALSMDIEWDGENHRIVLTYNKSVMFMKQGSNEYVLDNTPNTMPVAPAIFEGRTYLPLKAIVQAFGLSISADSDKKTIEVYTNLNITPIPKSNILGDVNCDLEINSIDLALQIRYILGKIDEKGLCINNADMNSDGEINSIDAALIRRIVLGFK